jgi:hypothetical protein
MAWLGADEVIEQCARLPFMAQSVSYCSAATCPELGANRKRLAGGQTGAIDPKQS